MDQGAERIETSASGRPALGRQPKPQRCALVVVVRNLNPQVTVNNTPSPLEADVYLGDTRGIKRDVSPRTRSGIPALGRELEMLELKRRGHGAADQGPFAQRARRLPFVRRNDDLRALAGRQIRAEYTTTRVLSFDAGRKLERRARIEVPDLGCIDAVPVGALVGLEQIVDRGASPARVAAVMPPCFGVVAAFGMRGEAEGGDDLGGGHGKGV